MTKRCKIGHIVCINVKEECGIEIYIDAIFNPSSMPTVTPTNEASNLVGLSCHWNAGEVLGKLELGKLQLSLLSIGATPDPLTLTPKTADPKPPLQITAKWWQTEQHFVLGCIVLKSFVHLTMFVFISNVYILSTLRCA